MCQKCEGMCRLVFRILFISFTHRKVHRGLSHIKTMNNWTNPSQEYVNTHYCRTHWPRHDVPINWRNDFKTEKLENQDRSYKRQSASERNDTEFTIDHLLLNIYTMSNWLPLFPPLFFNTMHAVSNNHATHDGSQTIHNDKVKVRRSQLQRNAPIMQLNVHEMP